MRPFYPIIVQYVPKKLYLVLRLEHDYWYQYLKKKFQSPNNLPVNRVINVSHIQKKADEGKSSRKRYSKIHQQRWLQVLQVCRTVEL